MWVLLKVELAPSSATLVKVGGEPLLVGVAPLWLVLVSEGDQEARAIRERGSWFIEDDLAIDEGGVPDVSDHVYLETFEPNQRILQVEKFPKERLSI